MMCCGLKDIVTKLQHSITIPGMNNVRNTKWSMWICKRSGNNCCRVKKNLFVLILSILISFLTEDHDRIQVKQKAASKEVELGK